MTESESAALPFGYSPMLTVTVQLSATNPNYTVSFWKKQALFFFSRKFCFFFCFFCFFAFSAFTFWQTVSVTSGRSGDRKLTFHCSKFPFFLWQIFPAVFPGRLLRCFSGGFFPADFFVCVFKKREPAGICPGRWFSRPRQEPAQLTVQLFLFASAKQVVDEQEHGIELQSSGKHVEHEDKL